MSKESGFFRPEDLLLDYATDRGDPGEFPFVRGIHKDMYRGRLWTMRQFAGFGTAQDTNKRFKKLLSAGETGLSTAFDLPTLYGYDSDHPLSLGEVGKGGVAIDTLQDMERLFQGIALDQVSVSMTINGPACVLLAMYAMLAEKHGVSLAALRGTTQNDPLKEFIIQKEVIVPHDAAMKIFVDTVEFCTKAMPSWNPVSISGYHVREGGATAAQELAFTLADGMAYVQACLARGLDVDIFAPRFSFFFDIHNDFFEEIAKLRAARKIWASLMRDHFQAKNPRAWLLRTHAQTAGCTLTTQQALNNIARVALQALAAVLGGVQSLHTNAYDEQDSLPSEAAVLAALRTQQIIAHESGVTKAVDPLGGSYHVEKLTTELEEQARSFLEKIEKMGGMVEAVKQGFPQHEIERSSLEWQRKVEGGEQIVVGVNEFKDEAKRRARPRRKFRYRKEVEKEQKKFLASVKQSRSASDVAAALKAIEKAARAKENIMPSICEAVKVLATEGEIVKVLKDVYGDYLEP